MGHQKTSTVRMCDKDVAGFQGNDREIIDF